MRPARILESLCGISFFAAMGLAGLAAKRYPLPFPPISESLSSPVVQLADFIGMAAGYRRLTGDLAWIQTLIYYGTFEEGSPMEEVEQGGGSYPLFLAYCERVAQLDPNFKYVFYYGGGVLGWNLNRLDEAEKLLKEGIRIHPKEWRFEQFLAGLAFQKNHNPAKLAEFLESYASEPDCPNLLRSILANIYKKQKRYDRAIAVWLLVAQTGDRSYLERAASQIKELAPLAHGMEAKNRF